MSEHQIFYPPPKDPDPSLTKIDHLVFGIDARRHPISGMVLENGSGALSDDQQAILVHCPEIARTRGKEAADAMRIRLAIAQRHLAIVKEEPQS